jgi:hypothetical protein
MALEDKFPLVKDDKQLGGERLKNLRMRLVGAMTALSVFTSACLPQQEARTLSAGVENGTTTGTTAGGVTGGTTGGPVPEPTPTVEIRHLVEPNITTNELPGYTTGTGLVGSGTYVRKLTLPKNYAGLLYVGGINIGSLNQQFNSVRFTFGTSKVARESITVPATVARAPGISPNTNINVLVLDLTSRPFGNLRMLYDLYDYKDYSLPGATAVTSNRDPNLYCRALDLVDDATFDGQGFCDGKAADNSPLAEQCLYTYADVADRALVKGHGAAGVESVPTVTQMDVGSAGYYAQTPNNLLNRCLPDKAVSGASPTIIAQGVTASTRVDNLSFTGAGTGVLIQRNASGAAIFTQNVEYRGPFRPMNVGNWGITGNAVFGPYGLFDMTPPAGAFATQIAGPLHRSKMFPRFAKIPSVVGKSYLQTVLAGDTKTVTTMPVTGTTELVDGCNARINSVNNGEHVGSCTATAKIEILNIENGVTKVIAETNDVVLQLVRGTQIAGENNEYLYGNFRICENNSQCGGNECCFNKRCWSEDLVAQCLDDSTTQGQAPAGAACTSDLECGSLCCNSSTGRCAVHDTSLTPPITCGKPDGQFCISDEWCQKTVIWTRHLVQTGFDAQGQLTCAYRDFAKETHGRCRAQSGGLSICIPPLPGVDPNSPKPSNPDCSTAKPYEDIVP